MFDDVVDCLVSDIPKTVPRSASLASICTSDAGMSSRMPFGNVVRKEKAAASPLVFWLLAASAPEKMHVKDAMTMICIRTCLTIDIIGPQRWIPPMMPNAMVVDSHALSSQFVALTP